MVKFICKRTLGVGRPHVREDNIPLSSDISDTEEGHGHLEFSFQLQLPY